MAAGNIAIPDTRGASATAGERRNLVELAIGYALILIVIWTPRPWQRVCYCAALVYLIAIVWRSFRSWRSMGFRVTNLLRSSWIAGIALAISGVAVLIAIRLGTLHATGGSAGQFVKQFWGYALWSLAQQLLLQDVFLRRLLRILPSPGAAVIAAAGMFALAHLPNPILTVVTVVWGIAACALFLRYRNLYTLGLAHAIFGITLAICLPGPVIRNMRVGLGYLTYRHPNPHSPIQPAHARIAVSRTPWA